MKKTTLILLACALMFASCDVAQLNTNKKDPTAVKPSTLFSGALISLNTFLHNPNVNNHDYMFMTQHWTMTLYTSETQYNIDQRDVTAAIWEDMYSDILINLQSAAELIKAIETMPQAEKKNKLASIEVMQVYTWWHLVTLFGNVPYTEALNPNKPLPAYTGAETVYASIVDSLNTAIASFDASATGFGSADLFYNGDISKWIKLANSLKLRMGMILADVNSAEAQAIVESAVAGGVFTSNADNAMMPFTQTSPTTNPVWENVIQSGRNDYVPAAPFVDRMNARNDPRRAVFFTKYEGAYVGGRYGFLNTYSQFSHFNTALIEKGRDAVFMGYAEVEFLLAEAAQRGYAVGGTAAGHYAKAITADMKFWGISDADIAAYIAQPNVAYDAANWRKSIGIQKWFALWGQWYQAWTSFRRLDYPTLDAPEAPNVPTDIVPVRYYYPVTEYRYNGDNVKAAASAIGGDNFTNALFWDVRGPGN